MDNKSYYTESSKKASIKYAKNKLKRIPLDVQLPKYDEIKQAAGQVNEPINTYIKTAIDRRIESGK
jgi:hypothetical protein